MADKSFEELLAELELEEEKDSEREPEPKESPNFKALRDAYKRQERELKTLREFRERTVQQERADALNAAGLSPRQAEAYLKMYDEVSDEKLTEFKSDVLGNTQPAPEVSESSPQAAAPNAQAFAPSAGGEPPGSKVYEFSEWQKIMKEDPVTGRQLANAGKVNWTYRPERNITEG